MKRILSFDISSSNIGFCITDYDEKSIILINYGVIKPPKKDKGSIFFRLDQVKQQIITLIQTYKPQEIIIEEILQFVKGLSTAKTIITLASFNRMIGLTSFEQIGKDPIMMHISTIRANLKVNNIKPKKEEVADYLDKLLNPYKFTRITKINRKTKLVEEDKSNLDLSDAIAVGVAWILRERKLNLGKKKAPPLMKKDEAIS